MIRAILGVEHTSKSVLELNLPRVCVLDLRAKQELVPEDKNNFDYLLFGGILGDHPPSDQCGQLRSVSSDIRHLGPEQMSTDGAINVSWRIFNGEKLGDIPFCTFPLEFIVDDRESVEVSVNMFS